MLKPSFTYMLRCADRSYYLGPTDELEKRIAEHPAGQGCDWTKRRLPVELVRRQEFPDREAARAAELQIKRWSRAKQEALIDGDYDRLSLLAGRSKLSRAPPSARLRINSRRLKMTSAASPRRAP